MDNQAARSRTGINLADEWTLSGSGAIGASGTIFAIWMSVVIAALARVVAISPHVAKSRAWKHKVG